MISTCFQPLKLPTHPDDIQLEPTISAAPSEDYSEITDFTEVSRKYTMLFFQRMMIMKYKIISCSNEYF